jgi:hypothetical protein
VNNKIYKILGYRNKNLSLLHSSAKDPKYCDYVEFIDENGNDDSGYAITINGIKQYEIDVCNNIKTAIRIGKRKNGNK